MPLRLWLGVSGALRADARRNASVRLGRFASDTATGQRRWDYTPPSGMRHPDRISHDFFDQSFHVSTHNSICFPIPFLRFLSL